MAQPITEDDIQRIYEATVDGLYRYVSVRCGGERDLAEDIVQETWLRAVRDWQARGLPRVPAAWLTTVARNLLVSHYRRHPAAPLSEEILATLAAPFPDTPDPRESLVVRALTRLPAPAARLLRAFHVQEHRVAQIAADEGLSERAVEGRLRRARQQLRTRMALEPDPEGESR